MHKLSILLQKFGPKNAKLPAIYSVGPFLSKHLCVERTANMHNASITNTFYFKPKSCACLQSFPRINVLIGRDYQHAQCFDYEHFLFQTEILENCHCPVPYCKKKLLLSDLRRSKGYNAPPVDTLDTFLEDHIKLADEKWSQSKKIHWNECANKF